MLGMMEWSLILCLLPLLGLTGAGQEYIQLLNLHHYDDTPEVLEAMSKSGHPLAVVVRGEDLYGVSSSVLQAEAWLRSNVLAHYPATQITTILVGDTLCCQDDQDQNLSMVLPSLRNLHHSLTRWGLQRDIKVSVAISPTCFDPPQSTILFGGGDIADRITKPLLEFLQTTKSTYSIKLSPKSSPFNHDTLSMVSYHNDFIRKLGFFNFDRINLIVAHLHHRKQTNRKLSSMDSKAINPNHARPIPLPKTLQPPLHSSVGFSVPSIIDKNPLPPQANPISAPPSSFPGIDSPPTPAAPFTYHFPSPPKAEVFPSQPAQSPFHTPAAAPQAYSFPPFNPLPPTAPAPAPEAIGPVQRLWCVAKPNVPVESLQEAMDYACGVGGADCKEITPSGSCFYPDTMVAHASYAFNSYWQKTKRIGGTCSFGGTAMLINSDPSFLHCRFVLG